MDGGSAAWHGRVTKLEPQALSRDRIIAAAIAFVDQRTG